MSKSKIEWTQETWNPTTGCNKISPGCKNCYAEREWKRLSANPKHVAFGRKFTDVRCHPERLEIPFQKKNPTMFFVDSMSDLFHNKVPDYFIADCFHRMALADRHTFQILTKRPERMMKLLNDDEFREQVVTDGEHLHEFASWPLKNVWLGVSTEDQKQADERIPLLLNTPAVIRFISAEPLLGKLDLGHYLYGRPSHDYNILDWVIVGGESGPDARPTHPDWVRDLRDHCSDAAVPFFFKQWGEWCPEEDSYMETVVDTYFVVNLQNGTETAIPLGMNNKSKLNHYFFDNVVAIRVGKKKAGRLLDGVEWNQMPEIKS